MKTANTETETLNQRRVRREDRVLRCAAVVFAIGFAFHTADHLRRGLGSLTDELTWAGTASSVMSMAIIAMVLFGHARAPQAAMVVGATLALAFASSHLLPPWSVFSDSFVGGDVALVSWLAALFEIAGAVGLAVAGGYIVARRHGRPGTLSNEKNQRR